MPKINVNNSKLDLRIRDNRSGTLVLSARDDGDNHILDQHWHLHSTPQLVRAYWLARRWTGISARTRRFPRFTHEFMRWPQFGPPLWDNHG